MRSLAVLGSLRAVVVVLLGITAVQLGLVAFSNITDYDTNAEFVRHVFAMDTTFRTDTSMWRAITSPGLATAAYVAIIAWETATALVLFAAMVAWLRPGLTERGVERARRLASLGWLMEVLLFGGGFIAIGGEWFMMWQSSDWNGLQPALQNLVIAAFGLVLVHLPAKHAAERDERDAVRAQR